MRKAVWVGYTDSAKILDIYFHLFSSFAFVGNGDMLREGSWKQQEVVREADLCRIINLYAFRN